MLFRACPIGQKGQKVLAGKPRAKEKSIAKRWVRPAAFPFRPELYSIVLFVLSVTGEENNIT